MSIAQDGQQRMYYLVSLSCNKYVCCMCTSAKCVFVCSNCTGFVEDEANLSYPDNGHLTQILWRATRYVGCADAVRPYDGGRCHTQVCRYSKPGKHMSLAYEIVKLSTFLSHILCSTFV